MFRIKSLCFVIVAVVMVPVAGAQESLTPKEALAMEIIDLTQADKIAEAMTAQIKRQMQQEMEAEMRCPAEREVAAELADSFAANLSEMMRSSELKADLILAYAELFTRDELQELVEFYRSDLGKKLVETQPEIMRRSMRAAQRLSGELQEKMLEAQAAFRARMKEIEGSCD